MFYRLVKNNADIWANIVVHNVVGVPYILPQKILETLGASLLYLHCKIRLAFFTWPSLLNVSFSSLSFAGKVCERR